MEGYRFMKIITFISHQPKHIIEQTRIWKVTYRDENHNRLNCKINLTVDTVWAIERTKNQTNI